MLLIQIYEKKKTVRIIRRFAIHEAVKGKK